VATTGMSAVIGPDGSVRQHSGALYTPDIIVATVPLRTSMTPATRVGALPEYVLSGLAAALLAWAVFAGVKSRRSSRLHETPDPAQDPSDTAEPSREVAST
jgi:apolipoprotein N-acyltransferase